MGRSERYRYARHHGRDWNGSDPGGFESELAFARASCADDYVTIETIRGTIVAIILRRSHFKARILI